jgi:putative hydrolase of the HAD superfamily
VAEPDVSDSLPRTQSAPRQAAGAACGPVPDAPRQLRGVITDWGGVLTNPLTETVYAWLEADGIDRDSYRAVMRAWVAQAYDAAHSTNPIRALERGECTEAEFERLLAAELVRVDGGVVPPEGLLTRMFAAAAFDEVMHDLIRAARRAGLRTALLSNSWGDTSYPRHLFPELFDVVVISAEVGMRKPEQRIFRLAAERIGLEPAECVFIDDIQENVDAARAAGLVGVRHHTAADTTVQLTELLGISL